MIRQPVSKRIDIKAQETIKISMDGKGRATDNIMIERFLDPINGEIVPVVQKPLNKLKQ